VSLKPTLPEATLFILLVLLTLTFFILLVLLTLTKVKQMYPKEIIVSPQKDGFSRSEWKRQHRVDINVLLALMSQPRPICIMYGRVTVAGSTLLNR